MSRTKLCPTLLSTTADRGDTGILSGKIFCRDCGSGCGAFDRDVDGVENRQRKTIVRIADNDQALNGWEIRPRSVVGKVRVEFGDNVILVMRQETGFDVQAAAACPFHAENSRHRHL